MERINIDFSLSRGRFWGIILPMANLFDVVSSRLFSVFNRTDRRANYELLAYIHSLYNGREVRISIGKEELVRRLTDYISKKAFPLMENADGVSISGKDVRSKALAKINQFKDAGWLEVDRAADRELAVSYSLNDGAGKILRTLVSIAGGVGTKQICQYLDRGDAGFPAVYYLIPNTAVDVMAGMTFMTSVFSTAEMDAQLLAVFKELGDAMLVEERLMNAGMGLSSCGIAYVMRYVRAATEGGVELGFHAKDAQRIIMQTMKGAVELLAAGGAHPEAEIDKVTTPGGLTIRGLNAMEEAGFTTSVIKGLRASVKS